jgi:hypothetical protein
MAYSRSEDTLKAMLPHLDATKHGRTQKWVVSPGRAWWWAGKVREALYIAREIFPHRYPELARAASVFVVEVMDDRTVQARPSSNTVATAIPGGGEPAPSESPTQDETPIHGLEPAGGVPRTIVGPHTATDIIAYCLRALPTNDKLVFTETRLPDSELDQLSKWAATRTPRWMVVVSASAGIVTLCPYQPGIPAWSPKPPTLHIG